MAVAYFSVKNSDNSGNTIIAVHTQRAVELYANDPAYTRLKISKGKALYVEQCRDTLKSLLPVKSTVWTCIRSVSKSGMSRNVSFHTVVNGEIQNITYLVSVALRLKVTGDLVKLVGCGTDVCYDCVYNLSRTIHPDGGLRITSDSDDQWYWKSGSTLEHRRI